jgi:hypothetical protein
VPEPIFGGGVAGRRDWGVVVARVCFCPSRPRVGDVRLDLVCYSSLWRTKELVGRGS